MNVKKIVNFIILRPAFTTRNLTSIGLVVLFFIVYVLSGGKITWVPNVKGVKDAGFGGMVTQEPLGVSREDSRAGMKATENFSGDIVANPEVAEPSALKGTDPVESTEVDSAERDSGLANIRERLKNMGK